MSDLKNLVTLFKKEESIQEEIRPLKKELDNTHTDIENVINNLGENVLEFIKTKLYENLTEEEKSKLDEISIDNKLFNPFVDKFRIFSYIENENGDIKLSVSCIKNESSISGLMTIYDTHETTWISKDEINNI